MYAYNTTVRFRTVRESQKRKEVQKSSFHYGIYDQFKLSGDKIL